MFSLSSEKKSYGSQTNMYKGCPPYHGFHQRDFLWHLILTILSRNCSKAGHFNAQQSTIYIYIKSESRNDTCFKNDIWEKLHLCSFY
jgi:hypothetical protein